MPPLPSLLACPPSTTLVDNFWTPDNASWLACEDLSVPGGGLTLLSARRTVHFPKSYEPYAPYPDSHYYLGLDKQTVLDAKWDMLSDHLLHSCAAPTKTTGLCEPTWIEVERALPPMRYSRGDKSASGNRFMCSAYL